MAWEDDVVELTVPFDQEQRDLYEANDPRSIYYAQRLPDSVRQGRQRHGLFAEIAVRAAFLALGFTVLISEPRIPDEEGFIVTDYAGKRRDDDPAYTRMFKHFPRERLEALQERADQAKNRRDRRSSGGRSRSVCCSTTPSGSSSRSRTRTNSMRNNWSRFR